MFEKNFDLIMQIWNVLKEIVRACADTHKKVFIIAIFDMKGNLEFK